MKYLNFRILSQPNDTTCGPTCLQAVYQYYGGSDSVEQLAKEVKTVKSGGTLAVLLACHALQRGYKAKIFTYNLQVFDPVWFKDGVDIRSRIQKQMKAKKKPRLKEICGAYLKFFDLGGELRFEDLTPTLIRRYLKRKSPIITGLSATYLYSSMREFGPHCREDDIRGEPVGHFVILCGYDARRKKVLVADPLESNPIAKRRYYHVDIRRVINAIMLGIITHDANLLILEPDPKRS